MIVNYIDFDFTASTIQEDFNNATKMAILTAKFNHSVISKVRVTLSNKDDKVELLDAFHEYNEKTCEDELKVVSFMERLKPIGISLSLNDNDINNYVYVVSWNKVWDSEEFSNDNKVFTSKKDAFKFYEDFKKNEIEEIKKKGVSDDWVENEENDNENAMWEYYQDFDYQTYHSSIHIDKREIVG